MDPIQLDIVEDGYKPGKLRVNFTDKSGRSFRFLSITDLGFFEYAERHVEENKIGELNNFIHTQEEIYIRLGLARIHQVPDGRNGYWMQVNGIYTFPEYFEHIRCYS